MRQTRAKASRVYQHICTWREIHALLYTFSDMTLQATLHWSLQFSFSFLYDHYINHRQTNYRSMRKYMLNVYAAQPNLKVGFETWAWLACVCEQHSTADKDLVQARHLVSWHDPQTLLLNGYRCISALHDDEVSRKKPSCIMLRRGKYWYIILHHRICQYKNDNRNDSNRQHVIYRHYSAHLSGWHGQWPASDTI